MRAQARRIVHPLASTALVAGAVAAPQAAHAADFIVGTADQFATAINTANTNGDASNTITLNANIDLTALTPDPATGSTALPVLGLTGGSKTLAIDGAGFAVDGGGQTRIFFANSGTIAIGNVTLANGLAKGGDGGTGILGNGGGGGMGAGGALFVRSGAQVNVTNVALIGNSATGGKGGDDNQPSTTGGPVGGGGGLGGNGGNQGGGTSSGGGGGALPGQHGADSVGNTGGAGGGPNGGAGGIALGRGDAGGDLSGGGGSALSPAAGAGGFGGGGGGGGVGGNGGFGGGGGAGLIPGGGGYGGGGGGNVPNPSGGDGGFGGGSGGGAPRNSGGGGAGMGGGIFVMAGASLTVVGALTVNGGAVTAGAAGANGGGATAGQAFGTGLFLHGSGTITFAPAAGTQTIADTIEDEAGVVAAGYTPPPGFTPGSWGLTKSGAGTLVLNGNNTFTGGVTIDGGTLSVGHNNALGSGTLTVLGSALDIQNDIVIANATDLRNNLDINVGAGATGTHAGTIFETGGGFGINKLGAGMLILSSANTYSGATNVNAGTLQAGAANTFSPFSAFNVAAGATLDLNNFNQTIGSLAGAGNVLLDTATLIAGGDNSSTTFSGMISGSGGLTKLGTGVLNLTGSNTYTGTTTLNSGGLLINGSLQSSLLTVNAGAFISGSGTLPSTTINGGSLAPGNSIGTITVNGNLVMTAGSTYVVEVSPTDADRTNVTGTATIAGTVQAIALPGSFSPKTYTILNAAGGVSGTFDSLTVTGTFAGTRNPHLDYDANNVFLVLDPASLLSLLPASTPSNPLTVAAALDAAVTAGATVPAAFDALFNFSGQGLIAALSQLDGEAATGMQQAGFKALDMFLGTMLNPFLHGRGEIAGGGPALAFAPQSSPLPRDVQAAYAAAMPVKAAPADFSQRWSVWGSAFGGTSNTDGDAAIGSQDTRTNAYGFAAGVDHRLTPDTLVGFALAGGGTSWSLAGGLGSGRSDMFQAGVYGSHRFAGSAYVSAAAAYAWHDASTNRNLTLAGVGQLDADFNAHSFGARLEGGYRWLTPLAGITPYAAAQVTSIRTPAYAETGLLGAAPFALAYNSQTTTATRTEFGLWFDRSVLLNPDVALTLRARAAWAHDFDDERDIAASFQTLPLASFTVFGASPAQDYALISGAAELRLRNGWSFSLKGDAELAGRTQTFSGNGTVRYAW